MLTCLIVCVLDVEVVVSFLQRRERRVFLCAVVWHVIFVRCVVGVM